jgi:plastocyanin
VKRRHTFLLASVLALAAAAPAAGAEVEVKALEPTDGVPVWDKPSVSILPGDTVVWSFAGTTQAHNVWSGASTNWSYKSTLALPAPNGSFLFATTGTYHFVCEVHDSMQGDVIVGDAPPPPPPPPGQQPFPNDSAPPSRLETGGLDTTGPTLRGVTAKYSGKRVKVSFKVSEQSVVTVRLSRGGKTVKTKKARTSSRGSLTVGGLKTGRYAVRVTAIDVAGNRSGVRTARLTVR